MKRIITKQFPLVNRSATAHHFYLDALIVKHADTEGLGLFEYYLNQRRFPYHG